MTVAPALLFAPIAAKLSPLTLPFLPHGKRCTFRRQVSRQ
jgi:hypothetical protein